MEKLYTCEICDAPMKFVERVKSNKPYRIRRFKCTICDFQKTIFADGHFDEIINPYSSVEQVKKQFKIEEENRE